MAGQFPSPTLGQRSEAWMYATAMLLARARYAVQRAANQMNPRKVVELLPVREWEYHLVPGRTATIPDRQHALAARVELAKGARYTAVTEALTAAIGDDFLCYRVGKPGELQTWPSIPATGPGVFVGLGKAASIVRLTTPVSVLGTATVNYEPLVPNSGAVIQVGDTVCASANNIGLAEKVFPTAATASSFTAFFTKSHDIGDVCTNGYFPVWKSTQAHVVVVVTPAAALDPEKRRKVDRVMAEVMRGMVIWDIVPDDGTGTATAAFTVEDPELGRVFYAGLGAVSYP